MHLRPYPTPAEEQQVAAQAASEDQIDGWTGCFELLDEDEHHRYARPERLNDKRVNHAVRLRNIRLRQ